MGFGFWVAGFGFQVSGCKFRVVGCELWVVGGGGGKKPRYDEIVGDVNKVGSVGKKIIQIPERAWHLPLLQIRQY